MMEWISVDERLPEDMEFVLVSRNWRVSATMEARYINGRFIVNRFRMGEEFLNPTHWGYLPEPPK